MVGSVVEPVRLDRRRRPP